ncbi:MAG: hypothetical protein ACRDVP_10745 [Acidimicrobiales bacterium]
MADTFDQQPQGFELDLTEVARSLGIGWSATRSSPLRRGIGRCVRYGAASLRQPDVLVARKRLQAVAPRQLLRLPVTLQEQHRSFEQTLSSPEPGVRLQRRARLLAMDLRDLGAEPEIIERELLRRGIHPATAFATARWAISADDETTEVGSAS